MSTELQEEPTPYQTGPRGLSDGEALKGMDWATYEQQSLSDLREAAAAYRAGERGMPAREFFDSLYQEDALAAGNA